MDLKDNGSVVNTGKSTMDQISEALRLTSEQLDAMTEEQLAELSKNTRAGNVLDAWARKERSSGRPMVSQEALDLYNQFHSEKAKFYEKGELYNGKGHRLTVAELRKRLNELPAECDDMAVTYQRIEDVYFAKHSWTTVLAVWEKWPGDPADLSEYIVAWGAYVTETKDGEKIFTIHAHY